MRIIVDAFGGDHAPDAVLSGCVQAAREFGVDITLTGDKKWIEESAKKLELSLERIKIVDAPKVIPVEAEPTEIMKEYSDCSMAEGLRLLAQEQGDAFISAGSTGALVVGASLVVKRMKGIKRAAIGTMVPTINGRYLLLDAGANSECRAEMLMQFAAVGSAYMEALFSKKSPKVGLLNIGAEPEKGTALQREAYELLKNASFNFVGNVEPRDIPMGVCDVVVTDGFTGNVVLKLTEGVASSFGEQLKKMFKTSPATGAAYLLMRGQINELRSKMDYTEVGGAMLMGISRPVIKAHGSSNAKAFKNAVRQAVNMVNNRVVERMARALELNRTKPGGGRANV